MSASTIGRTDAAGETPGEFMFSLRELQLILAIILVAAIAMRLFSGTLERAYRADVTLMVAENSDSNILSSFQGQLGGVASILGGSFGARTQVNEALATLRSRLLAVEFLNAPGRLARVAAVVWPEAADRPEGERLLNGAVGYLRRYAVAVAEDQRMGTIRVSFTWPDRQEAARFADEYVALANKVMRDRAVNEARQRILFLKKAAEDSDSVPVRETIFRVLEGQIKGEMLAITRPDYALRVMDPAAVPGARDFVRPKRWLLTIGAALAAGLLAVCGILLRRNVPRLLARVRR